MKSLRAHIFDAGTLMKLLLWLCLPSCNTLRLRISGTPASTVSCISLENRRTLKMTVDRSSARVTCSACMLATMNGYFRFRWDRCGTACCYCCYRAGGARCMHFTVRVSGTSRWNHAGSRGALTIFTILNHAAFGFDGHQPPITAVFRSWLCSSCCCTMLLSRRHQPQCCNQRKQALKKENSIVPSQRSSSARLTCDEPQFPHILLTPLNNTLASLVFLAPSLLRGRPNIAFL